MPIPGVCPSCGAKFDLAHALTDADARKALAAALALPAPLAKLVIPYLSLHAPQGRAVSMGKLARLLRDLTALVTSGHVERKRISHAAPLELWQQGIEQTLAARDAGSLILPLADHAYLMEVVWRLAVKAAGRAERPETQISHPSHRLVGDGGEPTTAKPELIVSHLKSELKNLQALHDASPNDALTRQIADKKRQLEATLHGD